MKRILFVTSKSLGGSGKYISSLAPELIKAGHHCDLLYFPLGVAQDIELESAFNRVFHFTSPPGFSISSLIKNIHTVRDVLNSGEYDWVHSHTSLGGLFGRLGAFFSKKTLLVGQTLHAYGADEFVPYPQKAVYWVIEKFLDLLTDAYVAPSKHVVDYGTRMHLINATKATVIYNALPLRAPPPDLTAPRAQLRAKLNIRDDEVVYLFCGRLEPQKGVDVLLDACGKLPKELPWRLVICGIGEDEAALKAQAELLGISKNLLWMGWQTEVDPFYAGADLYAMPSRWESFGLVFLEAMNFALPIVSTATQAIPEVVEDGVCGMLSPNEDVPALTNNLLRLSTDRSLRQAMGEAGRARLHQKFTFERFVADHLRWYQRNR